MSLIEWRDEFRVGVPSVDHEHKELIDLINELHAKASEPDSTVDVGEFLGEIHHKISAHFALEEKFMREQKYFEYKDHKADHERLLDDIRDIMDGYEFGLYADYRDALAEELNAWFSNHFKTFDARLHKFLD